MKRSVPALARISAYALAFTLIVLAVALSLLRFWLLPRLEDRRPELEGEIGRLIDERVRIGRIGAEMHGFHPELIFDEFRIVDPEGAATVRFRQVRVGIRLAQSLALRRLVPASVKIHGTRISLRRHRDGSLAIVGLTVIDHPPAWLLAAESIELLDSHLDWQDERNGTPPVDLGQAELRLFNRAARHRLTMSCRWPGLDQGGLEVRAELTGDLFREDGWGGRIYLEGTAISAETVSGVVPNASWLRSGQTDFRVWSDWSEGRLRRIGGRIDADGLGVSLTDGEGAGVIWKPGAAESWFRWRQSDHRSVLELLGLRLGSPGGLGRPSRMVLGLDRNDAGQIVSWRAAASRLNLEDLSAASQALSPLLSEPAGSLLRDLAAQGRLEDLNLVYRPAAERGRRFLFCTDLGDVSFRARRMAPGVSNLSGRLCGGEDAGSLDLRILKGTLDVPAVFRSPIAVSRANLAARWHRAANAVRFESYALALETADFSALGRLHLDLPDDPALSPTIDFQGSLSELAVAGGKQYLPDSLFPEVSRYLRSALLGGRIGHAEVVVNGPIADFPFDRGQGVFQTVVDLRKADFLYHPAWPPIQGADARMRWSGDRMEIDVSGGRLGNGDILGIHGSISRLDRDLVLNLDGQARAGVADAMDFLARSPLRAIPEGLLQFAAPKGDSAIRLTLAVPLGAEGGGVRVEGAAGLKNAELTLTDYGAALGSLDGELRFTETGLQSSDLSGVLLGQRVAITAQSNGESVEIGVAGKADTARLASFFPSEIWRFVRGGGAYTLALGVPGLTPGAKPPLTWVFRSDLKGVALHLPDPLGKSPGEPGVLQIAGRIDEGNRIPLSVSYGDQLRASLVVVRRAGAWDLESALLSWGDRPAAPVAGGLRLFGRFAKLDVGAWQHFLTVLRAPDAGTYCCDRWQQVELEAREVSWAGRNLGVGKLSAAREGAVWVGSIDGDLAKGRFSWTDGREGYPSLHLNLESLRLPVAVADASDREPATDPRRWPSLYLRSTKVYWRDADVGSLELDAKRQSLGLQLRKGELKGAHHRLSFNGDWLSSAGNARTRLQGNVDVDSLGNLASQLGHPGKIRDTRAAANFKLEWPGSPVDGRAPALHGEVGIRMDEGALLEFEPGWGRVIGMLNLNSIWRRLTLDFRDLVSKGLDYDRIEGRFRFDRGEAFTEGLSIDGVATRIVVDGSADLNNETLNQTVTVIPRTSVALPIAGTLAGGPAVGAAIFVAQELVGEQVDSITATRYRVTGRWGDPAVTTMQGNMPMELFDRAWSGLKGLSGAGTDQGEKTK